MKRSGNAFVGLIFAFVALIIIFLMAGGEFWKNMGLAFRLGTGQNIGTSTAPAPRTYSPPPRVPSVSTPPLPRTVDVRSSLRPENIPQGFSLDTISPYFRLIRIGTVRPKTDTAQGSIELRSSYGINAPLAVSGWSLSSNKRDRLTVPRGVENYDPFGYAAEADITLASGELMRIYSGKNPLGRNFRVNRCMAYIESVLTFTPRLNAWCPDTVRKEDISHLAGKCQDYIYSLRSCTLPDLNVPGVINDRVCQDYLRTLDYRGCYDRHKNDSDFFGREWMAWTGDRFLDMDPRHDRILLYDKDGFLVDEYVY